MFRKGIGLKWTKRRTRVNLVWKQLHELKQKSHLIVSGYRHAHVYAKIGTTKIWELRNVKLSAINIDEKSKFNEHVLEICR